MDVSGRLSDALNKREAVTIADVQWAPVDGSERAGARAGLKAVDPYDLIIVMAGEATLPPLTDAERTAHKVHKVAYDVALEVPPFRVIGTVFLYPGSEPERLLDRATEMFVPVVDATAYLDGQTLGRGDRRDPRQPVLPARGRADRPADRRAAPEAARRAARRHQLAGPLALAPSMGSRVGTRGHASRSCDDALPTTRCRRHGADDSAMHVFGRPGRRSVLMHFACITASPGRFGLVTKDTAGLDPCDAAEAHHRGKSGAEPRSMHRRGPHTRRPAAPSGASGAHRRPPGPTDPTPARASSLG